MRLAAPPDRAAWQRIPSTEPGSGITDAEHGPKGCIGTFSPIWSGKRNRSDEEVAGWERQQAKLNQDYESPWLSGLVTFSGFVAAFIGSVAVIFLVVHLVHGTGWLPFALMLAGLVGAHLCLRAVRHQRRRHAGHSPRSRSLPS